MVALNLRVCFRSLALCLLLPVSFPLMPAVADATGTVWAWGGNSLGQLGNNTANDSSLPVQVSDLTGAAAVAGGVYHSLALRGDGTVWAWGDNSYGELGNGQSGGTAGLTVSSDTPVQVQDPTGSTFLTDVSAIAGGGWHSLALKSDGTVWAWGDNSYGELGDGQSGYSASTGYQLLSSLPVQVIDLVGVAAIAGGEYHSLAVKSDGTVWAWGDNTWGELGDGQFGWGTGRVVGSEVPIQVHGPTGSPYLTDVSAVAGGSGHSLALRSDGTVWAWGDNSYGELGNGKSGYDVAAGHPLIGTAPVQVEDRTGKSFLTGVTAVAAGDGFSLALKSDGTVWAWGDNIWGQLGNGQSGYDATGSPMVSSVPVQVMDPTGITYLSNVISIAAGRNEDATGHSLALKSDGTVWAWGEDGNGELGDEESGYDASGNPVVSSLPVQVMNPTGASSLTGVTAIAEGGHHDLAIVSSPGLSNASVLLTSSGSPAAPGQPIVFSAVVSPVAPAAGTPTGTVTFLDGTTTLGTQALSNGVAVLSTLSFSGGDTISAFYSGDSTFASAEASLTQLLRTAWIPADVSVGADDLSRVLWSNSDGRATLWSLNRVSGNYTQGPVFGPFDGGAWFATRIACGTDGISHVLWNEGDGTLSLWWLNADNTFKNNVLYGPFAGWVATDIAVGSDNLARILWTNTKGQALLWSVDASGNYTSGPVYGPYDGYAAVALACGSDGLTRLVWANPLGIASYWIMNALNQQQSFTIFGPYAGWIPTDIDVGSDNLARLLWTNTVNGQAVVWSVDANGIPTNNQNVYGPFTGYTAQRIACGSDAYTRLMWLNGDNVLSFWSMAANNTMLTFNIYGPYSQ